jgi:solute carrier family 25 carnitine/acylcarnitine transporter 20/29
MGAPLATVALFNAVLFSARGRMEAALAHADGSPLTIGDQAIAGAGAGVAVAAIATPTELIKVRLQAQLSAAQAAGIAGQAPAAAVRGASAPATLFAAAGAGAASSRPSLALHPALPPALARGPVDVVRQVMAAEGGLLGLSRGLTCTLAREVPGNAVMFAVYESLKRAIASHQGLASTADLGTGALIVAGGAAGTAFWIPVFPADVVKSRWQADTPAAKQFSGVLDCAAQTWRAGGVRAMYRGFGPALVRAYPANAVCFAAYEVAAKALNGVGAGS